MTKSVLALALLSSFACRLALAEEAAAKPAEGKPAAGAAKKIDWEKMSFNDRRKYMKLTVLPQMKKLFVAFDAKRYAKMTCATCHSDKGPDLKFKMPSPSLPKLPAPGDRAAFMAIQQKKPEAVKFMGTQVKPKMAELLGLPEWQMNNPTGFGCYQCHTNEGPAAAPPAGAAPGKPGNEGMKGW
jgi:cytochrome c553